jgi:hypothetical protein
MRLPRPALKHSTTCCPPLPQVRATFQGISAAWGKVGAIAVDIAFSYIR